MKTAHVDELDRIEMDEGFVWRPVRRRFGIQAFGVFAKTVVDEPALIAEEVERRCGAGFHPRRG